MATEQNTTHVLQALDKLPIAHRGKTNIAHFLTALVTPIQEVENALWQLYAERNVDTAIGAQLTLVGKIVGQSREGVTDDDIFRRYVRARISVNRSKGTLSNVFTVADLVLDDESLSLIWDPGVVAAGHLRVQGGTVTDALAEVLIGFLRDTVASGVRIVTITQAVADSDSFIFPLFCQLDGSHSSGSGTLTANATIPTGFPASGTLIVDSGLAVKESIDYTSRTSTEFTLDGTTAEDHSDLAGITLDDAVGKGFSDNVTTSLGGQLANAKD